MRQELRENVHRPWASETSQSFNRLEPEPGIEIARAHEGIERRDGSLIVDGAERPDRTRDAPGVAPIAVEERGERVHGSRVADGAEPPRRKGHADAALPTRQRRQSSEGSGILQSLECVGDRPPPQNGLVLLQDGAREGGERAQLCKRVESEAERFHLVALGIRQIFGVDVERGREVRLDESANRCRCRGVSDTTERLRRPTLHFRR